MSDKPIAQRMAIKPDHRVLLINAPREYRATMGTLPAGAKIVARPTEPLDVIQVFVDSSKDLQAQLPSLKASLKPTGMLWVTYHKGTSKIKTDINRDSIAAYARSIGMQPVAMISIDDDWAALRLKAV